MAEGWIALLIAFGVLALGAATMAGSVAVRHWGFPLPDGARRMGCVDGLRGYLALSVMVYHFALWTLATRFGVPWHRPDSGLLDSLGPGSVNLFFMVTGFVFYPRILDGLARTRWPAVYVSRLFRIVPLVAASLLAISFVILVRLHLRPLAPWQKTAGAALQWLSGYDQPPLFGYPGSAGLDAAVLWSLGYEWLFYLLVLPAAAAAMDFARRLRLATWTVPLGVALLGLVLPRLGPMPGLIGFLPMFACGMLAFEAAHSPLAPILRAPAAAVPLAALYVAGLFAGHAHGSVRLACHAVFFAGVASGNGLFGLLRTRGALALGESSYSIYLLHGLILNLLFVDLAAPLAAMPLVSLLLLLLPVGLLVTLVALASFRGVEQPAIAAGKRLARRLSLGRRGLDGPALQVAP